jgi:hypothetical protein
MGRRRSLLFVVLFTFAMTLPRWVERVTHADQVCAGWAAVLAACFRTPILAFLAKSARSRRWPQLKYAGYSRFGRLEFVPIALKSPSALVLQQAASVDA